MELLKIACSDICSPRAVSYIQAVPGVWHSNLRYCDVNKFVSLISLQKGKVRTEGVLNSELSWKQCNQVEKYAALKYLVKCLFLAVVHAMFE